MQSKLIKQILYLLKRRVILGSNSNQNQLQELQEGLKEPQLKGDQLWLRKYRQECSVSRQECREFVEREENFESKIF